MSAGHFRRQPAGYLDSFRGRVQLALTPLPEGKNRRLKIDNPIEFIMSEREQKGRVATPLVW